MPFPAVVPAPASISSSGDAPFALTGAVRITGDADAAAVLTELVRTRTGLTLETGESGDIALKIGDGPAESYRLVASSTGIEISGADAAGLFYGIQTLGQLIAPTGAGWSVPEVLVVDAPRFSYRGVMLDVARHFHPVSTVRGYIDRASALKFNALHLHLTDDQGWRIEIDARPELTARASDRSAGGDPGGFYTKADYRAIVEYAASRHMIVVPEIDMPGHTHAVGLAYPDLVEQPVITASVAETIDATGGDVPVAGVPYTGIAVGFSSLRIHEPATYEFISEVFGELADMTPGPYLHLGGDEALGTAPEDFAAFVARASALVQDLGKTPVAWHEAGAAPGLAATTIGQYWGFVTPTDGMDDRARAFVKAGAQLILSPADAIYLDMQHPDDDTLGLRWANGPTSVRRSYEWEPSAIIEGITDADILGVEAPMWTETIVTASDIDRMAFPRIASAAEAAWSPASGTSALRTWESFRERVGALAPLWRAQGIDVHLSPEIDWTQE